MLSPPERRQRARRPAAEDPAGPQGPRGRPPRIGTDPDGLPARLGPVAFELGVITGDRSINPIFSALIRGPDDGFVGSRGPGSGE